MLWTTSAESARPAEFPPFAIGGQGRPNGASGSWRRPRGVFPLAAGLSLSQHGRGKAYCLRGATPPGSQAERPCLLLLWSTIPSCSPPGFPFPARPRAAGVCRRSPEGCSPPPSSPSPFAASRPPSRRPRRAAPSPPSRICFARRPAPTWPPAKPRSISSSPKWTWNNSAACCCWRTGAPWKAPCRSPTPSASASRATCRPAATSPSASATRPRRP